MQCTRTVYVYETDSVVVSVNFLLSTYLNMNLYITFPQVKVLRNEYLKLVGNKITKKELVKGFDLI
jgi:hypothetical protein